MNNEKFVITVTDQFCSSGRVIARRLAELLDVKCYNDYIMEEAARRLDLSVDTVEDTEERSQMIRAENFFSMALQRIGGAEEKARNEIFNTQRDIIKELGEKGDCVIVGRCSDFILDGMENSLHIYVFAPFTDRVRHCMKILELNEEAARLRVAEADKARRDYHLGFTGYEPDDIRHKGILVDSSVLGIEGTARMLENIVRKKFGLEIY